MNKQWKNMLIFMGILLVIALGVVFYFSNQTPRITGEVISDYEEQIDNFKNINELHWGDMPLTYKIENEEECKERQITLTKLAFQKIEKEVGSEYVSFKETQENPDISIYCKPNKWDKDKGFSLGDTVYEIDKYNENLITYSEINFYGQGSVCLTGYPVLEVHEILHSFGFFHNAIVGNIMHKYESKSSMKCKITEIDDEYISCLRYIYSNGEYGGDCSKISSYEEICEGGGYRVKGTDFCCPEPNMEVFDEFCY
jgi:hypothetical protein